MYFCCRPFVENTAAQVLYFFKSCYFLVSSLQIISGYPTEGISNFYYTKHSTFLGEKPVLNVLCSKKEWKLRIYMHPKNVLKRIGFAIVMLQVATLTLMHCYLSFILNFSFTNVPTVY